MLIFFLVALTASVAGAICGIGGGVIIKPVLDLLHLETVTAISFLSGCTVLSMSCYSVGKSLLAKEHSVSLNVGTPLALGAAAGGLAGNQLFAAVRELSGSRRPRRFLRCPRRSGRCRRSLRHPEPPPHHSCCCRCAP